MHTLLPFKTLNKLENVEFLDDAIAVVQRGVRLVIRAGLVKDLLHGVPLGHPLHPLAVQLPIGAWSSSLVLDFVPGSQKSADILLTVGTVCAIPAVISGWTDWVELHPQQQRVGLVRSVANATGTFLFGMSLTLRSKGHRQQGVMLSAAALTIVAFGGMLGASWLTAWPPARIMPRRSRTSMLRAGKNWAN